MTTFVKILYALCIVAAVIVGGTLLYSCQGCNQSLPPERQPAAVLARADTLEQYAARFPVEWQAVVDARRTYYTQGETTDQLTALNAAENELARKAGVK